MRIVILYHPDHERSREVETYAQDFDSRGGQPLELLSLETVQGAELAKLYDIVSYPAVLALANDGQLLKMWQEEQLPLIDEVKAYTTS